MWRNVCRDVQHQLGSHDAHEELTLELEALPEEVLAAPSQALHEDEPELDEGFAEELLAEPSHALHEDEGPEEAATIGVGNPVVLVSFQILQFETCILTNWWSVRQADLNLWLVPICGIFLTNEGRDW